MSSSALALELPDGTRLSVPEDTTPLDVARQIGPGLAKAALSSQLDGAWIDLRAPLRESGALRLVTARDDEAAEIWKSVGVPEDRIIRIATSANFWMMGPTGPGGPCSEIFSDHGEKYWGGPPGSPEEDGDRFVEIWNIVFMQNEQFEDGSMRELDMQSIDTGMGIERVAALLQGTNDNYATT